MAGAVPWNPRAPGSWARGSWRWRVPLMASPRRPSFFCWRLSLGKLTEKLTNLLAWVCWLVVWSMNGLFSRNSWEWNNHPNWRTHIFFRGVETTNQVCYGMLVLTCFRTNWNGYGVSIKYPSKLGQDCPRLFCYILSIFGMFTGYWGFWLIGPMTDWSISVLWVLDHWQRLDKVDTPLCKHCPVQRTVCDSIHLQ